MNGMEQLNMRLKIWKKMADIKKVKLSFKKMERIGSCNFNVADDLSFNSRY